jgi:hypothetical protein
MHQRKGTDITWMITVSDAGNAVSPASLADYKMSVFTFINGSERKYWLQYAKTPAGTEKQIFVDGNNLVIVIPRSFTTNAADGKLNVEVRITETDTSGRYENNLRVSTVHDYASQSDYFTICELVS